MVPQDHQIVHPELSFAHIRTQYVSKQVSHAIALENRFPFSRSRCDKKSAGGRFH